VQRRDTGRPEIVYGRRCKQDNIEHEVWITEFEVILGCPIQRGVKVGRTESDGFLVREGRNCFVEIDTGTMDRKQIKGKWKRYGEVDGFILVVTMTDARMDRLREWSDRVSEVALFTTFKRLRAGLPWLDRAGGSVVV
jgi:hypothetical protein